MRCEHNGAMQIDCNGNKIFVYCNHRIDIFRTMYTHKSIFYFRNKIPKQFTFLVTATYFTKAINGSCVHVDGGYPSFCIFPAYGYSIRSCITNCTNKASCVGFMYNYVDAICAIIPTDGTCPSGFNFILHSNTAETVNDLVAYPLPGTFCYGKHSGNDFLLFENEYSFLNNVYYSLHKTIIC